MKTLALIFFALVCIFAAVNCQDNCPTACPYNYSPKCGFNGDCYMQFPNDCEFKTANCRSSKAFDAVGLEACSNPSNKKCSN